jgi:hypothetical protein
MGDVTPRAQTYVEPADSDLLDSLSELIVERFNPPDDDSYDEWYVIGAAADFIEAQPCDCPLDPAEDTCPRCEVLGRRRDIPHAR